MVGDVKYKHIDMDFLNIENCLESVGGDKAPKFNLRELIDFVESKGLKKTNDCLVLSGFAAKNLDEFWQYAIDNKNVELAKYLSMRGLAPSTYFRGSDLQVDAYQKELTRRISKENRNYSDPDDGLLVDFYSSRLSLRGVDYIHLLGGVENGANWCLEAAKVGRRTVIHSATHEAVLMGVDLDKSEEKRKLRLDILIESTQYLKLISKKGLEVDDQTLSRNVFKLAILSLDGFNGAGRTTLRKGKTAKKLADALLDVIGHEDILTEGESARVVGRMMLFPSEFNVMVVEALEKIKGSSQSISTFEMRMCLNNVSKIYWGTNNREALEEHKLLSSEVFKENVYNLLSTQGSDGNLRFENEKINEFLASVVEEKYEAEWIDEKVVKKLGVKPKRF